MSTDRALRLPPDAAAWFPSAALSAAARLFLAIGVPGAANSELSPAADPTPYVSAVSISLAIELFRRFARLFSGSIRMCALNLALPWGAPAWDEDDDEDAALLLLLLLLAYPGPDSAPTSSSGCRGISPTMSDKSTWADTGAGGAAPCD